MRVTSLKASLAMVLFVVTGCHHLRYGGEAAGTVILRLEVDEQTAAVYVIPFTGWNALGVDTLSINGGIRAYFQGQGRVVRPIAEGHYVVVIGCAIRPAKFQAWVYRGGDGNLHFACAKE